jgi:glycolate oxidase iron-sulfur subunit
VVHTAELLDWATGGPLPGALAGRELPEQAPEAPVAAAAFW